MKLEHAFRIDAHPADLAGLIRQVTTCAAELGVNDSRLPVIELVVEEIFINICKHAYGDAGGGVEVRCGLADGRFVLEMVDFGQPFDLTSLPDPDLTQDVQERKVGGLGVYFIKKMTDAFGYRREDNGNVLKVSFSLDPRGKT
jgi:serine/threonine-protein kinase RsbW